MGFRNNEMTFYHIYYFVIYSQLFGLIRRSLFDLLYRIGSVKEVGAVKRDIVLEVGILLVISYIVFFIVWSIALIIYQRSRNIVDTNRYVCNAGKATGRLSSYGELLR